MKKPLKEPLNKNYMKLLTKIYNKNPYLGEWAYSLACFWLPIAAGTFILFYGLNHMFINH